MKKFLLISAVLVAASTVTVSAQSKVVAEQKESCTVNTDQGFSADLVAFKFSPACLDYAVVEIATCVVKAAAVKQTLCEGVESVVAAMAIGPTRKRCNYLRFC